MTPSVLRRTGRGARRVGTRLAAPLRRIVHAVRPPDDASDDDWRLDDLRQTETRWRRGDETVRCFRFDDGYVSTVEYGSREVTWQLTPGQVPLASALAMTALYLQHGTTPQSDPDGRPFVAVGESGPRQVFEEIADEPVDYVYLDAVRTLEEFPAFVDVGEDLQRAYDQMSPTRFNTLG
ncbi:hypothetical protein NDI76_09815 [Halogeometricum sp. S1BR25-6]|uniref:Uncharacterized protein n=1 Tax=Halogeometricum salsisoli TaxID=2950536 RepID=A0ABU2GE01_9EURY|nr:hypothetical protein [Halogeometricum sp. S1BR25-6]MDS0299040.1 hypothetical protein [Halogeometricum sp. S1BR25-6]